MPTYASLDAYLAAQSSAQQPILRRVRALVKRAAPDLVEAVKWGNACWLDGTAPIAYAHCASDHVQLGFMNGAALPDPRGLLQGSGRFVRHVKLGRPADVAASGLTALLREAVKLGHPAFGAKRGRTARARSGKAKSERPRRARRGAARG